MANFQRGSVTFDQALDFTRGSEATYFDSSGVLQTAAVNEPRFDHDPVTGEPLGLLIEEQRTRLNTIAAAPTATENVTVTAAAHTISFFGTGSVTLSGVSVGALEGTGADDRVTLTFTPTAGTLTLTPSGTVADLQLEAGASATSVIRGEGSQVTRSADIALRTLGTEFNPTEFTMFFEIDEVQPNNEAAQSFLALGELGNLSRSRANIDRSAGGGVRLVLQDPNGVNIVARVLQSVSVGSPLKVALSIGSFGYSAVVNGFPYSGPQVYTGIPDSMIIGRLTSTAPGALATNSTFKSVRLYPRALSEAELIALAAPEA